ncbi:flagellar hook-length control protein FliK [Pinisolibacter sp. MA2-2]|nr:flagellar hook-length control protein FliK [Pinisolibacter aquiterrae]
MAALAESIAKRGHQGTSRFSVRLDPAELGSVDVRVEVKANGEVKAHLVVERADTLDMMLRDQKTLERSLASAGLDVGSSGLQFSMRDRGDGSATPERDATPTLTTAIEEEEDAGRPSPDVAIAAYRTARAGGVDLRI